MNIFIQYSTHKSTRRQKQEEISNFFDFQKKSPNWLTFYECQLYIVPRCIRNNQNLPRHFFISRPISNGVTIATNFVTMGAKTLWFQIWMFSSSISLRFFPVWVKFRVSVQGVKSLGGHFACLWRGIDFYDVKKKNIFQKEKENTFTLLIIFIVKSLQK